MGKYIVFMYSYIINETIIRVKKMKRRLNIISFMLCFFIFIVLLFQNYLETIFIPLKNLDEFLPVLLILLFGVKLIKSNRKGFFIKKNIASNNFKIICNLLMLFFLGIISSMFNRYQPDKVILSDSILIFKGFATYVFASYLFCNITLENYYRIINNFLRFISVSIFLLTVINYKYMIFPNAEARYGIPSQQLFFSHPTYLASFVVAIITLLTMLQKRYNMNYIYILLMLFVAMTTQRNKVMAYIGIYIMLYLYFIKKEKKVNVGIWILIGGLALYIGGEQLVTYIVNPEWARSALTIKSFVIANDHFPLGSGFGTFATWTSGVYYSPLYSIYGISHIYGLSESKFTFVGDVYWPAIIAQFGYIGIIFVINIILKIYNNVISNISKYKYFGQVSLLIYLLILSTSETSFMSPVGPLLCLILAL